jgi:hypothetical protein
VQGATLDKPLRRDSTDDASREEVIKRPKSRGILRDSRPKERWQEWLETLNTRDKQKSESYLTLK